jgi:serine/threonine protein kinase
MSREEQVVAVLLKDAATDPELAVLRGYEYAGKIWKGGMGAVALVRRNGENAALKFILPEYATHEMSLALFNREVANMRALQHDHIVQLFGAGVRGRTPYFLMEFCDGGSVWDLAESRGGLPLVDAVRITLEVLDALEYAHQAEIPNVELPDGRFRQGRSLVHRDIKPQNILLARAGSRQIAKLGDYGLAKVRSLAGMTMLTASGSVGGTPVFMARQQLEDYRHAGPEVDVWAVAASLYWMLTLRHPRDFGTDDVLNTILETAPVPIRKRGVRISDLVADVLDEALDDTRDLRFQSAGEFRRALSDALEGNDAESAISAE